MYPPKGFSLIEAMLSFFILLLITLSIFSVLSSAQTALQGSGNRINAAFLGNTLLEQTRAAGFLYAVPSSGSQSFAGVDSGSPFSQTINYVLSVQSLDVDKKLVWATMTWNESTGNKQLTVETILVNPQ